MSIAYEGQATPHLPANIPGDRFVYPAHYQQARYAVVDNYWRNWGVTNVAGLADMMAEIERWPLVFESGEIAVYRNQAPQP